MEKNQGEGLKKEKKCDINNIETQVCEGEWKA